MKKSMELAKLVSLMVRNSSVSQAELAANIGMSPSQLNRYLNKHSELTLKNFIALMDELGFDIIQQLKSEVKKSNRLEELKINSIDDCLLYFFKNLDPVGKQTLLKSLEWSYTLSSKKEVPEEIKMVLNKEIKLV